MQEPLFSIICTTCQAKLKVLSEAGIGTIQTCPRCGSMVEVLPPPGWQPRPRTLDPPVQPSPAAAPQVSSAVAAVGAIGISRASTPQPPPLPAAQAAEVLVPPEVGASPTALALRTWLLLGAVPMVVVAVAFGTWVVFRSAGNPPPAPPKAADATKKASALSPNANVATGGPVARDERRWLPNQTRLMLRLRISRLGEREEFSRAIERFQPAWHASVKRLFEGFGLKNHAVVRVQWASTELGDWADRFVAVIELEKDQDSAVFQAMGQPIDLKLAGTRCRRLPSESWPYPFAVLAPRTIVTGAADLLGELADRKELHLANASLARLVDSASSDPDVALLADLSGARQAGWRLPTSLMDVWASLRAPWHVVCEVPQAVAITAQTVDRNSWEIALTCEGETAAERVHAALEVLLPAVKAGVEAQSQWLAANRTSGRISADAAAAYGRLLQQASAQIDATRREIVGPTVWVRFNSSRSATDLASAAWANRETIRQRWLDAARTADTVGHHRLLESLNACRKAEGSFPAGAGGGALLPPETRLSWIAGILPYLEHQDWHQDLDFRYSWNGAQNGIVARRPLGEVINPILGPSATEAGFPVTHYVGVAGVGGDAGRLKPGDPRAGVFGYSRRTRPEDIPDGTANTIATLGVENRLGPWAAGGDGTVRALTQRPYVNGPDGFGSGQPDGMLAGMADGSVRFLSKDIDPTVLEQLATVGGGEPVTLAALDAKPAIGPQPASQRPAPPATVANAPRPAAAAAPVKPAGTARPIVVDESRLSDRVPKIELADMPLVEAVRLLSQISTLPISFDLEAMAGLGVELHDPVKVRAVEVTVRGVLEALVAGKGLAYLVDKGQVLVTAPADYRTTRQAERYSVTDLAGSDAATAALAAQILRLVAPDAWVQSGGRGTIEVAGGTLALNQTRAVLHQVAAYCERLRMARSLSPRNPQFAKRLTLQSRLAQARAMLGRRVTTNFHEAAPLAQILSDLEHLTGATIVVNWRALGEEGVAPRVDATLKVEKQPLDEALVQLLHPLGLTYRVFDATTIEVTSRKAVAGQLQLEFYPVGALLGQNATVEQLIRRVKDATGGGSWHEAGGPGAIDFDRPSECLIVLQSQPVQAEVETLLSRQRAAPPRKAP